jgi:flagella basal body P-ring formation protein FlgA
MLLAKPWRMTHEALCTTRAVALLMVAAFALVPDVRASAWQDANAIRAAAEEATAAAHATADARVAVAAAPLDPRLRVPACDQPLEATLPALTREAGRVTAEVRCAGSSPWRLHVPVRVTLTRTLVVAARPLERGKILAADDVILAERDVAAAPGGYLTGTDAAVGRVLRRNIAAGAVLAPSLIEAPVLVRRGQAVTLEARSGAIRVQMAGIAQADGALGQTIAVRNNSSRKVLHGVVRNERSVEIRLP